MLIIVSSSSKSSEFSSHDHHWAHLSNALPSKSLREMQRNMAMALPCRSPSSHKHPKWQQQGEKPHFPHMPTRSEIAHGALAPSHEHIQSFPSAHSWAELLTPHPGHLTMVKGDRSTNPMVTMTEQPPYASLGFSQPLDQQSSLFSPRKVLPSISYSQGVIKVAGKAKHSLFAWR